MLQNAIRHFTNKPKQLFLVDAFGALLSAILLGAVLVRYESIFGIPEDALYTLAAIPCLFALYDVICYFTLNSNYGFYLKIIAAANVAYCLFSLFVAFQHREAILTLGWIYILVEIVVVFSVAHVEWEVSKKISK